jgi:Family of unknown function (DUF5695)
MTRRRALSALACSLLSMTVCASHVSAQTLSNSVFKVAIGTNGEISSLQLTADAFPTNYVLNATNAAAQNTADHAWVGELMFTYRLDTGAWTSALTNQSSDVRKITQSDAGISVSYENSANAMGIQKFKLVETYALAADRLSWTITVTNPTAQTLELGDLGLPLPFNEQWSGHDVIYETRTVYHSFTGQNSSYITASRPSGVGPFLLMIPDASTGAGFEYMDNWRPEEHADSAWAAAKGWDSGLDVFYIHSDVIKSTHRGYLPNTSLVLAPNQSKTYTFNFFQVASHDDVKSRLYSEGLIDVSVVPSMMFASNMTAKFDLHTSKPINAVTPQYPAETKLTPIDGGGADHHIYQLELAHLGPNDLIVSYGAGETTTLQFYALEPVDVALQRHATFMVQNTVSQQSSDPLYKVFDDWLLDTKARRAKTGKWGWGDDWGWTKAQFLAEKNAQTPVASEVSALDDYFAAVWGTQIDSKSFTVEDWWCTAADGDMCSADRAFAYPHAFNSYFSMYKVAHLYPQLIAYHETADTYLLRAYSILHTLYSGHGEPGTGYMGEQTLPEIIQALRDAKHTTEAAFVTDVVSQLYKAFQSSAYPYGSEYSYDNTGEEAVYMAAKLNNDAAVLEKVNNKTRACRGHQPVWYYYADPVTLNGENWWQFQYSASLIGYCMDDWLRGHSKQPELDERLSYAAKLANISAINSGQIDAAPENLGSVAWTYQAMKGDVYVGSAEKGVGTLHNSWREMSGEAELGLFGALRILSADVALDPLFGLYGYGCEVAQAGSCYAITPHDGVFKRLNLISEKLYVELERDRYDAAMLSSSKDYVALTLHNQTMDAHTTKLTIVGLAPGSYPVSLDGVSAGTLTATSGQPAVLSLALGANATSMLQIGQGCAQLPAANGGGAGGSFGAVAALAGGSSAGSAALVGGTAGHSIGNAGAGALQNAQSAGTPAAQGGTTGSGAAGSAGKADGCSCQTLGHAAQQPRSAWLLSLAALLLGLARRRRSA